MARIASQMTSGLTAYEIASAFPAECNEYIPRILKSLKAKIVFQREKLFVLENSNLSEAEKRLHRLFLDFEVPHKTKDLIKRYEKAMGTLRWLHDDSHLKGKKAITLAKQKSLQDLYTWTKFRLHGTHFVACCPFHAENTPSFVGYLNNTFHCFGCQENGDVIDFYMKLNNATFKDALKALQ